MEKCLIVAVADNRAIGKDNALLWHISEDLRFFKSSTLGGVVIMGYQTYLSLGSRPLPKRVNIVISKYPLEDVPEGVKVARTLAEAYSLAGPSVERVFVMGGGETYRRALPGADKLYVTHVRTVINDADTFFPVIDPLIWELESESEEKTDPESGLQFRFAVYGRR